MTLAKRLEQAAKKYDRRARSSASDGHYDFGAAELRDLLEAAAKALGNPPVFNVPPGFVFDEQLGVGGYIEYKDPGVRPCLT